MFAYIVLILGILYGYFTPGRQNKMDLFKTAIIIGIVLGLVMAAITWVTGISGVGFGEGVLAIVIGAVVAAVLFVVGAWIGDFLEDKMPRKTA